MFKDPMIIFTIFVLGAFLVIVLATYVFNDKTRKQIDFIIQPLEFNTFTFLLFSSETKTTSVEIIACDEVYAYWLTNTGRVLSGGRFVDDNKRVYINEKAAWAI